MRLVPTDLPLQSLDLDTRRDKLRLIELDPAPEPCILCLEVGDEDLQAPRPILSCFPLRGRTPGEQ